MSNFRSISDIRRDYGEFNLNEDAVHSDPIIQFKIWFEEVIDNEQNDPTAMVFSTVDPQGFPDSRVVLLKGLENDNFVFYTNYQSAKAKQLELNSKAAINFYWPQMARQVRIRGLVQKVSREASDIYFSSRPINSQLSAVVSPQSKKIPNRAFLDNALHDLMDKQKGQPISRPDHWGGYMLIADEIEFWQGRDNRLHDRILYVKENEIWVHHRLAP
ncbi:MAG: pyridoxamine 5'-phosphate oxidase [bacterium]|nr:pyridoxamine 5'-phosphate oxidase [bacterium]